MTRLFFSLLPAARRSLTGLWVAASLMLSAAAYGGTLEPFQGQDLDFELEDLKGKVHKLEMFQGKVLLINFWASWCPPCIREMPALKRLEERMAGKPFAIVAINVSEKKYKVRKFVKLIDLRLKVLLDEKGETFKAWGNDVLPTSFLLDPAGRIAYIGVGPLEWDGEDVISTIESMLNAENQETPASPELVEKK